MSRFSYVSPHITLLSYVQFTEIVEQMKDTSAPCDDVDYLVLYRIICEKHEITLILIIDFKMSLAYCHL